MPYQVKATRPGRTGVCDIATIMWLIRRRFNDQKKIAAKTGLGERTVGMVCADLQVLGLIHAKSWNRVAETGRYYATWAWGEEGHVPHPFPAQAMTARRRADTIAFSYLWKELAEPSSTTELIEAAGFNACTTRIAVAHMRELKLVAIADWHVNNHGDHTPLYARGPSEDAPKPPAKSKAELERRAAARRKIRKQHARVVAAISGPGA